MADKNKIKLLAHKKRKNRLRNKVKGTPQRPRLSVFRSNKHIYAQLIDDMNGKSLTGISSLAKSIQEQLPDLKDEGKTGISKLVGKALAQKAIDMKIESVVFDRNGFVYHGRVKAVADGAREGGLKF